MLRCPLPCFTCALGAAGEGCHRCWQRPWHLGCSWPQNQSVTSLTGSHLTPPSLRSRSWVTTVECGRHSHFSQAGHKHQGLEGTWRGWVFQKQEHVRVGDSTCTTRTRSTQLCLQHPGKLLHCKLPTCVRWAGGSPWRPGHDNFPTRPPAERDKAGGP